MKIENMDLENLQQNLTNSIKRQKLRPEPEAKLEQGDSAVSAETLMDVKSQQLQGKYFRFYPFRTALKLSYNRISRFLAVIYHKKRFDF